MKTTKNLQSEISSLENIAEEVKAAKKSKEQLTVLTSAINREKAIQEELTAQNNELVEENEQLVNTNESLTNTIKQQEKALVAVKKDVEVISKEADEKRVDLEAIEEAVKVEEQKSIELVTELKAKEEDLRDSYNEFEASIKEQATKVKENAEEILNL